MTPFRSALAVSLVAAIALVASMVPGPSAEMNILLLFSFALLALGIALRPRRNAPRVDADRS